MSKQVVSLSLHYVSLLKNNTKQNKMLKFLILTSVLAIFYMSLITEGSAEEEQGIYYQA